MYEPSAIERLAIAQIERRRSLRPAPRPTQIQPALQHALRTIARSVRQETAAQSAWRRLAPPDLASRLRVTGLARGTLTLAAGDQSAKFLADRFLASGGRSAMAAALGVAITRVKITTSPRSV